MKALSARNLLIIATAGLVLPVSAQGTQGFQITTQRSLIDWQTDLQAPTIWMWEPLPEVPSPIYSRHTTPWLHVGISQPQDGLRLYTPASAHTPIAVNQTAIDLMAASIVNEWHLMGRPTDYAIFIHGWAWKSGLFRHPDDYLAPLVVPGQSGIEEPWLAPEIPYRGSPWKDNGVLLAGDVLDALITALENEADPGDPNNTQFVFPAPSRFILDEEELLGYYLHSPVMNQVFHAINDDTAHHADQLVGDHSLRLPSGGSQQDAETVFGLNQWSFIGDYTYSLGDYPSSNDDHYAKYFLNEYYGVMGSVIDGAIEDSFDLGRQTHPSWANTLVTNYGTSVHGNRDYPKPGTSGYAPRIELPSTPQGWQHTSGYGSTDAQSPYLYGAWDVHRTQDVDLLPEAHSGETPPATLEDTPFDMWLRINRSKLDHILFTLDAGGNSAPPHIIPWLPRIGTSIGSVNHGATFTTESFARDVLALAKAKGVREAIWWGGNEIKNDPDRYTDQELRDMFTATGVITDQVWNLNLVKVVTYKYDEPPGSRAIVYAGSDLGPFLFSDEHTKDVIPAKSSDSAVRGNVPGYVVGVESRFQLEPTDGAAQYHYPERVKFIIEVLDGGGAWDLHPDGQKARGSKRWDWPDLPRLRIKNRRFTTANGEPRYFLVSGIDGSSIRELFSTSTRRSKFGVSQVDATVGPPNGSYGISEYVFSFDDDGVENLVDNVIDRKTILEIEIPLNFTYNGVSYTANPDVFNSANKQMEIYYEIDHDSNQAGALSYRLDMLQMYDITPTADRVASLQGRGGGRGDLNNDGIIDTHDFIEIIKGIYAEETKHNMDINNDGIVNLMDVHALIEMIND